MGIPLVWSRCWTCNQQRISEFSLLKGRSEWTGPCAVPPHRSGPGLGFEGFGPEGNNQRMIPVKHLKGENWLVTVKFDGTTQHQAGEF